MRIEHMYQELILEHYRHPQNRGLREPFDSEVHHVNPTCGDELTVRVTLDDTNDTVVDVSYDGQGCSISQASVSVMTEQIIGKPLEEAMVVVNSFESMITSRGKLEGEEEIIGDGIAFAGVSQYPARVKCALLGWAAFKDAVLRATDDEVARAAQESAAAASNPPA